MDLVSFFVSAWGHAADSMIVSQSAKLFWSVAGFIFIVLTLRYLDMLRRKRFRDVEHGSQEMFAYYGLRFFGACLYFGLTMTFGCLCLAIVLPIGQAQAGPQFPARYDAQIYKAAKTWMPGVPWRLWKAQLYQESRLDPTARSPVGAEGLAQFMPATWQQVTADMGYGASLRTDAGVAINAGAYYMARLRRGWMSPRPEDDRHNLAMASYNAGMGSLIAAQRACGMPVLYEAIMRCLPQVTGIHARETAGYAPSIRRWFAMMEQR